MTKESSETKKALVSHVAGMSAVATVVTVRVSLGSHRSARTDALKLLATELAGLNATRIVVESCDQDRTDRQVIGDVLAVMGVVREVEIIHLRARDEPLLWVPDIVAWAFGRSDSWRTSLKPLIVTEIRI